MENKPKILSGSIMVDKKRLPIEARYATKYSLLVVLKEKRDIGKIDDLELKFDGTSVSVGPCKIILETENNGQVVHVMPQAKFHNFEKLFFRSRIETLESVSLSLPLLVDYKKEIKPEFKEFVSNLTYDLNVYNYLLGQMDAAATNEPQEVRDYIHQVLIGGLGSQLAAFMKESQQKLETIVGPFSEAEHEHHGFYFRRQLWHTLLQAPLMARTNLKPRGYVGDSEMMRMIYKDDYQGDTTFGKILHKYSVDQPAAQSVRNRRSEVMKMLRGFARSARLPGDEKLRVLSVACGPAIEIKDILRSPDDCAKMHFSLLDQDARALAEAESLMGVVGKTLGAKISYDLIKESARIMLVNPDFIKRWGSFHFIYSMGLFDYFATPVAAAVLTKLYELLNPGGVMVIGNLHPSNPSRCFMEYWHDWKIIYRTEEEFLELAKPLPGARSEVRFDETGIQMLLTVKKVESA